MNLTKRQAKKIALEMCDAYLKDKKIVGKRNLPFPLYQKIKSMWMECPLCDYNGPCEECPLYVANLKEHGIKNARCGEPWITRNTVLMKKFRKLIAAW